MKRLLFLAVLATVTFTAKAVKLVHVFNPNPCALPITVTFVAFDATTCSFVDFSQAFPVNAFGDITVDLDNPATWGGVLPPNMCFGASVCICDNPLTCTQYFGEAPCFESEALGWHSPCCTHSANVYNIRWEAGTAPYTYHIQVL